MKEQQETKKFSHVQRLINSKIYKIIGRLFICVIHISMIYFLYYIDTFIKIELKNVDLDESLQNILEPYEPFVDEFLRKNPKAKVKHIN